LNELVLYDLLRNNLHVKAALNDIYGLQIHMNANSNERGAYFENTLQTAAQHQEITCHQKFIATLCFDNDGNRTVILINNKKSLDL